MRFSRFEGDGTLALSRLINTDSSRKVNEFRVKKKAVARTSMFQPLPPSNPNSKQAHTM
jgi:hypothetical protein